MFLIMDMALLICTLDKTVYIYLYLLISKSSTNSNDAALTYPIQHVIKNSDADVPHFRQTKHNNLIETNITSVLRELQWFYISDI